MNTQPDAMSTLQPQATVTAAISPGRRLYWTIRREFWENRSLYLVPVTVAVLFLAGFFISLVHLSVHMHTDMALGSAEQYPYVVAADFIMGATLLVAMFYCVDALYSERRDRSILFWKSLPISDLIAVLAKAAIAVLVLPLLMFGVIVVTQAIMVLLSSAVMLTRGQSVAELWTHLRFFRMTFTLCFHLVAMHGLWYAPIYCWLLMASAFAPRAPILWAVLPPAAIGVLEKIAFGTSHLGALLAYRFIGGSRDTPYVGDRMSVDSLTFFDVGRFLIDPGLWTGLIAAAAFLAVAVWLRRSREPM